MTRAFIARAAKAGLAKIGEPSLLRGADCGHVHIARGVTEFAGVFDNPDDNPVVRYDVATISIDFDPRVGDTLEHPDGTYVLDKLIVDNRYTRAFVVVPA